MPAEVTLAPGAPGVSARWTSSSKSGIGKSINAGSEVAFTISHGILNEIFYPREDIACVRDMGLIVTQGDSFFAEEKRDTIHEIKWMEEGVPAFHIVNTCRQNKFCIEKEVITDTIRDTVLQKVTIAVNNKNNISGYNLYAILAPHIHNQGGGNSGWKGDYKGIPMFFAHRNNVTLAFACSTGFQKWSVGFVGNSDGYTDIKKHNRMAWEYQKAEDGNIALTGQIDISENKSFVLAIGFGRSEEEAGNNVWASILDGFDLAKSKYIYEWQRWQRLLKNVKSYRNTVGKNFRTSAAVLRLHESKKFPGGIIASLSIPWGQSKGDGDLGGYHLVWPRDLVLSAGGFLSLQTRDDVLRILNYLMATQEADGKWSQNMWLEGIPYWEGVQMDQVALPVVLVQACFREKYLTGERLLQYWPIIKKSICFILKHGPYTMQDRWEEEQGLTPFTLAAEIAALLAGAALAELNNENELAKYCRETADYWNENIENWLYVTDTALSRKLNIEGYYMRINPHHIAGNDVKNEYINLKNHEGDTGKILLGELVSVDALALVRFGLRAADDPKILNTVKAIDAILKIDTPNGPCWHRYNNDGYGEDEHGNPFTHHGIGRAWPLLTGERGHYEIAAGNIKGAINLLNAMESFSNNSLLPEQIWDSKDIPEKNLFFGKHSGSAMPLTWAHAEYLKLCSSIKAKKISDMPSFTQERYIRQKTTSSFETWRFSAQRKYFSGKSILRIEVLAPAMIRWTDDDWETSQDTDTKDTGIQIYIADIVPGNREGIRIQFTFFWKEIHRWENENFEIEIKKDA